MTGSHSDANFSEEIPAFDSRNSEIIILDGPGDTTIEPESPHLLPILKAEWEKILRWQQEQEKGKQEEKND